jgi:hypothetical protein
VAALPFAQASNSTRLIKKGQTDQSTKSNHRWPGTTSFFTALEWAEAAPVTTA